MCVVTLCELVFCHRQAQWADVANQLGRLARVSILSSGCAAMYETFWMFFHLTLGLLFTPLRPPMWALAAFQGIVFLRYKMATVLAQWRLRRAAAFAAGQVSCELAKLYLIFYAGLVLLGSFLMLEGAHGHAMWIAVLFHSQWIPQIVHSARNGTRNALSPWYLIGSSATRFVYVLCTCSFGGADCVRVWSESDPCDVCDVCVGCSFCFCSQTSSVVRATFGLCL